MALHQGSQKEFENLRPDEFEDLIALEPVELF